MNDDFTFDWAVLAPITDVETTVEHICVTHNLNGTWFESHPDGLPVKGCRIMLADTSTLAVLTLQGYYEDQTHLRLQPAARAVDQATDVAALADDLYKAFRTAGWMPSEKRLFESTPRFMRPQGFRPRPNLASQTK
ncbi:MAG: hypothetical protein GFH27_549279n126 [Chloroflexi bacterium AL-W]|nr:hypothetical protein [Chloroflexi bacterium AL-N1]NOK65092.1 hypothetical protein [Chloroflexi bacterium AL-N10]NOK72641.1 hypothetical protein [Chloroflexi bacterium AL-N5]NOK79271.1 hypothetical protein [Chloroflexi bacterium AL-W]NOK87187.1 hypothetical protein [Chloroflexi bacterium AL-N15]